MIPILYESTETIFASNGIGRLYDAISVEVTEERNGVYQCDFEMPVDGAHFEDVTIGRIIAVSHDETGIVEPFDIVGYERPIGGIVKFHAVHISYRLAGVPIVGQHDINSLASAFGIFNSISINPFTFSADFTSNAYISAFDNIPRTIRQLMGGIEGSVLDACGGEWEFNRFSVTLRKSRGKVKPITVRYGVNLSEYNESADASDMYNAVVPYWIGQDAKGNDTFRNGSRVDSGMTLPSGRDVIVPLDLSEKFESMPTIAQLKSMAQSVMGARQPWVPARSIKVNFLRFQDMGEYDDLADLWDCSLCDTITVVFPRCNVSGQFKIVKVVWDALAERYKEMELGQLATTLSEALGISSGGTFTDASDAAGVSDVMMNGESIVDDDGIAMVTDANGNMALNGQLTQANARYLYGTDTSNNAVRLAGLSSGNNFLLGDNNFRTYLYGSAIRPLGHSSDVGTTNDVSVTGQSIASGASFVASGASVTLAAGVWSITGSVGFAGNTSGRRGAAVYAGGIISSSRQTQPPVPGASNVTRVHTSATVVLTASTAVSIRCFQNSGAALSADTDMTYTRIW